MNNTQKLSNLLGLAQRAGKLISGGELVIKSIQSGQAYLVFLANDAGANLTKKITDKCDYYSIEVSTAFTTLELSTAIGKPRKAVAVADAGFSKKMRTLMD
ncbi:YlxQ-related RNA-binding protein [Streptococcus dentiloxodontae]